MDLMHPHRAAELHDTLHTKGHPRPIEEVDQAIQSAIESITADEGYRPSIDNEFGWWSVEPLAVEFLDLDVDLILPTAA